MKIGIANDHSAVDMKKQVVEYLVEKGYEVVNYGTDSYESCPYPKYGEKIVVGVDARDGYVAINGWKEITDQESFSFCEYLRGIGVKTVIYTDISRDGGLEGTNMEAYKKLQQIEGLEVTASGGISFEREITELKDIVSAAILGKAIYSGALDLARAVELAE